MNFVCTRHKRNSRLKAFSGKVRDPTHSRSEHPVESELDPSSGVRPVHNTRSEFYRVCV